MKNEEPRRVRRNLACIRAHWRAHVSAQASSGLAAVDYCRAHGLRPKSFYRWRRVLRESGELGELLLAGDARPVDSAGSGPNALFAEVRLPAGVAAPAASGVEVVLQRGAVVRVSQGFDPETLSRVVSALEEGAC